MHRFRKATMVLNNLVAQLTNQGWPDPSNQKVIYFFWLQRNLHIPCKGVSERGWDTRQIFYTGIAQIIPITDLTITNMISTKITAPSSDSDSLEQNHMSLINNQLWNKQDFSSGLNVPDSSVSM
ncbi:hypothetical protein VNO77_18270 [Canavalia gladiata]|uniref:Uncharacterized protein n=1 Tax=Canavalia gladiata TaxID=3824 RepID=A0AAN9QHH5_CANGL